MKSLGNDKKRRVFPAHVDMDFSVWRGVPSVMERSHTHTDVEINLVLSGRMRYFIDGKFHAVEAGAPAIFWAGMPHELIEVEANTECVWAVVPLTWFLQWQLPPDFVQDLLEGALLQQRAANANRQSLDRALFNCWVEDLSASDAFKTKIVAMELEARLRRLAAAHGNVPRCKPAARLQCGTKPHGVKSRGATSAQTEKMARYINRHYHEKLTVKHIARAVGLHPKYAMRVFKEGCGMSLGEYVAQLRLSHAQRLLLTTDLKIGQIAIESGFGSTSRFYETFARECGVTPRRYRAAFSL